MIGAMKSPKISPNLIHPLFKGVNNLEFKRPKIKNTVAKNIR